MIASDLYDLQQYITSEIKVNCSFSDDTSGVDTYPLIKILMVEDYTITTSNQKTLTIDLPLDLHIVVSEGDELKALEVFERLLLKINQYKTHTGSLLEGSGRSEYVEETGTFEISVLYNYKQIIQDT